MIEMSADTVELFKALVAFQAECPSPAKTATNPHFRSKFSPLDTVLDTVKPFLAKHGLSLVQFPCGTTPGMVGVVTQINHVSGQWMRCAFSVNITKNDPQMAGSGISYARRYAVLAALNLAAEDDDGESATRDKPQPKQSTEARLNALASGGERAERPLDNRSAQGAGSRASSRANSATAANTTARGGDPVPVAKVIESVGAQTSVGTTGGDLAEGETELPWVKRNNTLAMTAHEISGIKLGEMDDLGMYVPSMPCPVFSENAGKQFAGKRYDDPKVAGYLREKILPDPTMPKRPIAVQLWALYAVARHETKKQLGLEDNNG